MVYVLFDHGATHSFVLDKIEKKLNIQPDKLEKRLVIISTSLSETIDIDFVFQRILVNIGEGGMKPG